MRDAGSAEFVKTRVEFNLFTGVTLTNVWNIPVRAGFPRGRGKRRPGRARSRGGVPI
jgi:hypothetical protein